jgi:hypothetical protein
VGKAEAARNEGASQLSITVSSVHRSLPIAPMRENRESSELVAEPDPLIDPELVALPGPPRQERTISLLLMAVTGLLAAFMAVALAGDVKYAFAGSAPEALGDLGRLLPTEAMSNTFVRADGVLHRWSSAYPRPRRVHPHPTRRRRP